MIINIKRNKEPILWREQIEAEIESLGATPNYGTITAELSRELNVPIENLRIKHAGRMMMIAAPIQPQNVRWHKILTAFPAGAATMAVRFIASV